MASSLKKNSSRLTLVKKEEALALPEVQVVSYEKLSLAQIGVLNKYLSITDSIGNCVGALVGSYDWDVRPLVIENNKLTLTRFTEPEADGSDYKKFMSFGKTLQICGKLTNISDFGSTADQLWVKRVFYQSTFKDKFQSIVQLPYSDKKQYLLELISLLQKLHEKKIYHGNISLSNITLLEGKPVYLDFGLALITKNLRSIENVAPEVLAGEPVSAAADVYSLGKVFEQIIDSIKSLPLAALINNMTCPEPKQRLQLYEVLEFFEERREEEPVPRPVSRNLDMLNAVPAQLTDTAYSVPERRVHSSQKEKVYNNDRRQLASMRIYLGGIILGIFLAFYLYARPGSFDVDAYSPEALYNQESYAELWQSGQPSMMQIVVRAAAEKNDKSAQFVIVKDVLAGKENRQVNTALIKTAFDPRWEASLTDTDRKIVLILSTAGLFSRDMPQMPALTSASPIVLLSIMGVLQIDIPITDLQAISVEKMVRLPSPYDKPFREFQTFKAAKLDDRSIRALSHIVLGNFDEKLIENFFAPAKKDVELFKMARIVLPLLQFNKDLDGQLYGFLVTRSQVFAQAYRWFDEENFSNWDAISRGDKITIVTGVFPDKPLPFEKYADLLKHPNPRIAKESAKIINDKFYGGKMTALLTFLASDKNRLNRYQTISILAALSLQGKEATDFYTKWFQSNPDVNSVLEFLILRSDSKTSDIFNLRAAQYLSEKEWTADLLTLKRLVLHPESLARAQAYAKLNKHNPEHLSLLNAMSIAEPNPRLREKIRQSIGN